MNDMTNAAMAHDHLDRALEVLEKNKVAWTRTSVPERIAFLDQIKERLMPVAQAWAETAAAKKGIPADSPLVGEEWVSGPYALMAYCNALMHTLSHVKDKGHLAGVPLRHLPNGQLAARVVPASIWDHLLLSGVSAEIWMEPGVTEGNLKASSATGYDPAKPRIGKVALVLGAGNIAAIAPLDCLHKLFVDNEVVILKMNPVNDYLVEFLDKALSGLTEKGFLSIVKGDASIGQYLCNSPLVQTIHITGSGAAHDAIVWGSGAEGVANKMAGTPKNLRPMSSELGGVAPTIVVPGHWSRADLEFQAEHVATQKLHNAGFNCIASQVLVLSSGWAQKGAFLEEVSDALTSSEARPLYYPGAQSRLAKFGAAGGATAASTNQCLLAEFAAGTKPSIETTEVFAPALGVTELPESDAEAFLVAAIEYANTQLAGTLGANILIHPRTMRAIGRERFDAIITKLHYGSIAVNAWTGLGFLSPQASWGAFPGHTLADVQSGIGFVHNTLLFERVERTVIEAPFKPFPRNLLSLSFTLLPRPPWFVTNARAATLGKLLTRFQYRPSFLKLPAIFLNALFG